MKENYESPEMDIIRFEEEDVITSSIHCSSDAYCGCDYDNCIHPELQGSIV